MVTDREQALTRTLDLLAELLGRERRDEIDRSLAAARIRLVVERRDLLVPATQAALYVVAMLVVRSGMQLAADLPRAPRLVDLPGLDGDEFGTALGLAVPRMFPGAVLARSRSDTDLVVAIGAVDVPGDHEAIRLGCIGLRARASRQAFRAAWRPAGPLPALAAAGLAGVEVHKRVLRPLATGDAAELLSPLEASYLVPFAIEGETNLGSLVAISGGAITQNMFLTLAAESRVRATALVMDADGSVLTNANRCPYVLIDQLGLAKVHAIRALMPGRISIEPIARHLDAATIDLIHQRASIVVGADDIAARHLAQRADPEWLAIGATSHFLAMITEHPVGAPCAGCAHPILGEDVVVIPTISIVSFWAGYLLALRLMARAAGEPYPLRRRVTNFWPLRADRMLEHPLVFNPRCPLGHVAA